MALYGWYSEKQNEVSGYCVYLLDGTDTRVTVTLVCDKEGHPNTQGSAWGDYVYVGRVGKLGTSHIKPILKLKLPEIRKGNPHVD